MIRTWLAARTRSELVLCSVGAATIAGALYFFHVIEPLQEANARLHRRVAAHIDLHDHLLGVRDEIARLTATVDARTRFAAGDALLSVVTATARDAGVQQYATKMTPIDADLISLLLEDIPFGTLSAWLLALDREHGVEVERITIEADSDPGVVSARAVLRTRRAES